MAPPMVAAMVPMSMSRLVTWLISWARTPRSWRSSMIPRMPVVTATAAWLGLRPGRERVGLGTVDDVQGRHRDAGAPGQVAHDALDLGRLARLHRPGAVGLERDPVAEPVHADVEQRRRRRAR